MRCSDYSLVIASAINLVYRPLSGLHAQYGENLCKHLLNHLPEYAQEYIHDLHTYVLYFMQCTMLS